MDARWIFLVGLVLICPACGSPDASRSTPRAATAATVPGQNPAPDDSGNWIRPAKDYASTRFSSLNQITTESVANLGVRATFSTGIVRGHEAAPASIAWSPDGTTIASGSEDRKVRLWDVARRETIGASWEHPAAVTAVTFSPDGSRVAAGTKDGSVHVWEVKGGKSLYVIPSDGKAVHALAFAPDGGALAVGYHESGIRVFGPDPKVARLAVGQSLTVNNLRYLPDGSRLVAGAADNTVRLWDAATGRLVLTLREHGKPVTGVATGGSTARIVSASVDGTVRIRNARSDSQGGKAR